MILWGWIASIDTSHFDVNRRVPGYWPLAPSHLNCKGHDRGQTVHFQSNETYHKAGSLRSSASCRVRLHSFMLLPRVVERLEMVCFQIETLPLGPSLLLVFLSSEHVRTQNHHRLFQFSCTKKIIWYYISLFPTAGTLGFQSLGLAVVLCERTTTTKTKNFQRNWRSQSRLPLPTPITIMGKASLLLALRSSRFNGAVHSVQPSHRRTLWLMLVASNSDEIGLRLSSGCPFTMELFSIRKAVQSVVYLFIHKKWHHGTMAPWPVWRLCSKAVVWPWGHQPLEERRGWSLGMEMFRNGPVILPNIDLGIEPTWG